MSNNINILDIKNLYSDISPKITILHHLLFNKEDLSKYVKKYFRKDKKLIYYNDFLDKYLFDKESLPSFYAENVNKVCYGFFEEYQNEEKFTTFKDYDFIKKYFFLKYKDDARGIDAISFLFVSFLLGSVYVSNTKKEKKILKIKKKALVNVLFNKVLTSDIMSKPTSDLNENSYCYISDHGRGTYVKKYPGSFENITIEYDKFFKKIVKVVNICNSKSDLYYKTSNVYHRNRSSFRKYNIAKKNLYFDIAEEFVDYLSNHLKKDYLYLGDYCDLYGIGSNLVNVKNLIIDFLYRISR